VKLATIDNQTRDGRLILVRSDGQKFVDVSDIAPTLQVALDRWDYVAKQLETRASELESGQIDGKDLDVNDLLSPLPRAYEWIDGSAYINHIVLVRKARGAEPPETLETDPLIYQGGSGTFLRPTQDIPLVDEAWGLDFESEIAVVLGDTPVGVKPEEALQYVRLIMLVNDITLRNLIPAELAKSFGFFQSKPSSAFSPFAVTPDELGDAWRDGRVHLPLKTTYNDELFGDPDAGPEMHFGFHQLIAHIAKTRPYTAGTILGSGTVSNHDRSRGSSCLAEKRMIEKIDTGEFHTPFMKPEDTVRIEMFNEDGQNIFGTISQRVKKV